MTCPRIALFALVALGLGASSAQAAFVYTDFSSVAGLQLNGSAQQVGNVLRLTPSAGGQSGSAFTTASTPLGNLASFSTYFQFQITNNGGIFDLDGQGADGIVFVIQTQNNNAGGSGGGIGYQGISPSIGVEFDTWNNGLGAGDPNGNHVGVDLNGSVNSVITANEATRFNDGSVWNAWVDYDGTTLEVRWSTSTFRPTLSQLSYVVDLQTVLGQNSAFLGFTAGTGAAYGDQDILHWEYVDRFQPISGVPEPASVVLLGLGALGAAGYGWRRKRAAC